MKRIGVLTGGGDAPGLNAVIRALTLALDGAEVLGIEDGYLGLIERRVRPLGRATVAGIEAAGGTILGTTNRVSPLNYKGRDWCAEVLAYARELRLDGVVAIGGDGTMSIASALHARGLPTLGLPKTIDNDIACVERSLGFDTAVATVTEALERSRNTGASHGRVMLVETMGRTAGWLALEAGLAGAADIILLPEIDFDLEGIAAVCAARAAQRGNTLISVAEGAKARGGEMTMRDLVAGAPEPQRLGGVAEMLARALGARLPCEVRATILGHVQRGGTPTPGDRLLGTLLGETGATMARADLWGSMVTVEGGGTGAVALADVAGRTRRVPLGHHLLTCARHIGVVLGEAALPQQEDATPALS
ncbi:ATP-dependent 6-phosphofructokinase [Pseudoduganella sp. DS3]|uniref:ATP-dependent 6-phosphofructokinase n=1 Tax=Pseudoduganella guangdongensis TaxID=2692179 RepID=A0A6N9HLH1_9BURK|nr:ATP-dependent 6-phosphofructokinase [Pseudoduganella guangdongensis]MYN04043.1 ATP-dependent 6-phosphofructokinase [Pseudoduganella guangdongensis]